MIRIPSKLVEAIRQNVSDSETVNAAQLRANYQSNKDHQGMYDTYLMSRMPATYAAISRVLQEIPLDANVETVLDIGSGPGTGLWAVRERFDTLESYVGLEGDQGFISLAERLNTSISEHVVAWMPGRYPKGLPNIKADLVLMSYTVGENSPETVAKTIDHVWAHNVSEWLVVIEPGTPKGFKSILEIRAYITANGGNIYAPCKGNYNCPLIGQDWCHFSVRLERSQLQKKIKDATLPYEDEKFSYLIVRNTPVALCEESSRIIKKPMVRPGHITLDLCNESGYERKTVSKSQKETYRTAKKVEWGDSL
ncbi:small ribosomal subunit Rsm22 family protein [Candidatus Bodocaedibacter vickermanii]|uniref:rRNA methyltransferase n=1 Tax=Candidatus Bodocaedibacter vickermanii TaxID=2741701 RepID=A0A7L9RS61_9PROT|nr:rRNA methyltransferase [Candidatus Paracaedibacteraceae bacterium 'Lake Konstanz']